MTIFIIKRLIYSFFLISGLFINSDLYSQKTDTLSGHPKRTIYINWGYNNDWYTKSTLHFKGYNPNGDFNFTAEHAHAHDQPDRDDFFNTPLTVPQYNLRIGYFFNEKRGWGIEWSWDHLKYVMTNNQMLHVKGQIYGKSIDKDTLVTPEFVRFEHTNGNNYCMLSFVKRWVIYESKNSHLRLSAISKNGAGVLIPKTASKILGYYNDGPFRVSGFVLGTMGSVRVDFFKYFFFDTGFQAAFADYNRGKIYQGKVTHRFISLQYLWSGGINIPLQKK